MHFFEWLFKKVPRTPGPDIIVHPVESPLFGRPVAISSKEEADAVISKLLGDNRECGWFGRRRPPCAQFCAGLPVEDNSDED